MIYFAMEKTVYIATCLIFKKFSFVENSSKVFNVLFAVTTVLFSPPLRQLYNGYTSGYQCTVRPSVNIMKEEYSLHIIYGFRTT